MGLDEIKTRASLKSFDLVRLPRLSVMPVSETQWNALLTLAKEKSVVRSALSVA